MRSLFVFIFALLSFPTLSEIEQLENLDYQNPKLIELRKEVKENLRISKMHSIKHTPKLRFMKYKIQKGDNFFKIMTRTGMDIDTISSVNSLSSPYDIRVGMLLYIPNMRGVYDKSDVLDDLQGRKKIAEKYQIPLELPIFDSELAEEWFIPGKTLSKLEKSFFYGLAFVPPLMELRTTSHFGKRIDPFTKKKTFHGGIDLAAPSGTSVYASAEGEVIFSGNKGGYGKLVVIRHILGYETRYGHLEEIFVTKGEKVRKNQEIGTVGSTGRSTGPHLHFEVRRFHKNQKPEFYKHM
ncbi:MAG: M23 family metallopeptidase [Leptospiraceae bacterium]|nr:M23 family metallopeptidase [Leptospiraceae bacterium]